MVYYTYFRCQANGDQLPALHAAEDACTHRPIHIVLHGDTSELFLERSFIGAWLYAYRIAMQELETNHGSYTDDVCRGYTGRVYRSVRSVGEITLRMLWLTE